MGFFNAQMPLHLQMCFSMLRKDCTCAEGFASVSKLCSPLNMEAVGPSELFLGKKRIAIIYYFSLPLNEIQNWNVTGPNVYIYLVIQ